MDLAAYLRYGGLIFRTGSSIDMRGGCHPLEFVISVVLWSGVLASNLWPQEGRPLTLRGFWEASLFIAVIPSNISLLIWRKDFIEAFSFLQTPLNEYEKDHQRDDVIAFYNKWVNRVGFMNVIYEIVFVGIFVICICPLFVLPFYAFDSPVTDWPLPVSRIPFNTDSVLVYCLAYLWTVIATLRLSFTHISVHMIFLFCGLNVHAKLRLLAHSLERLQEKGSHHVRTSCQELSLNITEAELENNYLTCLVEIAKKHVDVVRFVKVINSSCQAVVWVTFQFSIVLVVVTATLVSAKGNFETLELVITFNILLAGLMIVGVFNFMGQLVIDQSEYFRQSLFSCAWPDRSKDFKTCLRIMMAVSYKPLTLRVGGLYHLSLETHGNILSAMYSYFNFLMTMHKNEGRR